MKLIEAAKAAIGFIYNLKDRGGDAEACDAAIAFLKEGIKDAKDTKRYLLVIEGDVEPSLRGPYRTDKQRLLDAKDIRSKSDEDGVYRLNIAQGNPDVSPFTGGEVDPNCQEKGEVA